jgi:hypothetical protein
MEKPLWVETLLLNTSSFNDFISFMDQKITEAGLESARLLIEDERKALAMSGEMSAMEYLRTFVKNFEREES